MQYMDFQQAPFSIIHFVYVKCNYSHLLEWQNFMK